MKMILLTMIAVLPCSGLTSPVPLLDFPPGPNHVDTAINSYRSTQAAIAAQQATKQKNTELQARQQQMRQQLYDNAKSILLSCSYKIEPAQTDCGDECSHLRKSIYRSRKSSSLSFWKKETVLRLEYDKAEKKFIDAYGNILSHRKGAGIVYIEQNDTYHNIKTELIIDHVTNNFTGTEYAIDDSYEPMFSIGEPMIYLKGKCKAQPMS